MMWLKGTGRSSNREFWINADQILRMVYGKFDDDIEPYTLIVFNGSKADQHERDYHTCSVREHPSQLIAEEFDVQKSLKLQEVSDV